MAKRGGFFGSLFSAAKKVFAPIMGNVGKVVSGMDIVNKIKSVQTGTKNRMPNWPNDNVVMEKVVLK